MALNTLKCNHFTPLGLKGLTTISEPTSSDVTWCGIDVDHVTAHLARPLRCRTQQWYMQCAAATRGFDVADMIMLRERWFPRPVSMFIVLLAWRKGCLSTEDGPPANMCVFSYASMTLLLLWPWPWPDDRDIRNWPRCSEDVLAYQTWSF